MKKLFMLIAIAACAVGLQAATVSWTVTNIFKGNATDKAGPTDGYMCYLIADTTYSQSSAASALDAGTLSASDLAGYAVASSAPTTAGKVNKDVDLGALPDGDYTYYTVISDGKNAVVGSTVTANISSVGDPIFGSFNAKTLTQNSSNWKSISGGDVPEPTSGLLLLLGGAMLALRRKQK